MYLCTYNSIVLHSYLMPMCNCQDFNLCISTYGYGAICKIFQDRPSKFVNEHFCLRCLRYYECSLCFMIAFPAANSKGFNSVKFLNKNKQILSLAPFSRTSLLIRESFSSLTGVFQKIFGEKPSPCHSFCYTVVAIVDISGRISVLIFLLLSM